MKRKIALSTLILLTVSGLFIAGCGNSDKANDTNKNDSIPGDTANSASSGKTEMRIYALPAQMQIPSALRDLKIKYSESILTPANTTTAVNAPQTKKAIVMGIFGVDMGYATVFDQNQAALNYFSKIARLAEDMQITGAFDPSVINRLKNNASNRDSASYLLLSSFNNATDFLNKNNRKDVGLLVAAGSFIEGLYISTSVYKSDKSKEALNIIGMQKIFAGNLVELLSDYSSQKDISDLSASLQEIQKSFEGITVTYTEGVVNGFMGEVKEVTATDEQINDLTQKVSDIRKQILQ